ncbi:DUF427 domain-containing protein [Aquipuribacter sp. SD81]|uniref:DUF427 domain-containing protein n=1 Tax=Aquipuribacter sp. SD81 TaxID=3127703 RepID=UPI0030193248
MPDVRPCARDAGGAARQHHGHACPYEGDATYRSLVGGPADVAWGYEEPLPEALPLPGHVCFMGGGVRTEVDGRVTG